MNYHTALTFVGHEAESWKAAVAAARLDPEFIGNRVREMANAGDVRDMAQSGVYYLSAILESYPDWVVALNNAAMYLRLLGEPHSAVEFLEHSYQVQLRDVEHSPNSYHQESLLSFTQGLLFDTLIHASMFEELIDHTREIPESLAPFQLQFWAMALYATESEEFGQIA